MTKHLYFFILFVTLLSACASPSKATQPVMSTSMPADMTMEVPTMPMRTQYPVTIKDCGGRETTYTQAPERVVTLDPAVTEALLLLGLKDKIVGFTEFQTPDQRWSVTRADMDALTVINKDMNYPSKEAILAVNPDLVMSIYPSALLENKELPDRDGWTKLGINSYLTLGECHLSQTPVTDLSLLYTDLRNFGIIFDVQEHAEAEISKLQQRVDALQKKVKDAGIQSVSIWSYSGETDPYPAGAVGTPNAVITLAGATNAFGDVPRDYDAISWEEIVKRNPDVIWVMTSAGSGYIDELKGIEDKLAADPRLVNVTAVKQKAYIPLSYNDGGVETPRNVDALEIMINGLLALKSSATSMHTQYPVTITDCDGRQTTYNQAPERVVTIDPSVTETLLVLGLKDKIVGYTEFFTPDQQWATTKADMSSLNMINDGANYPSKEAVAALKPDLVVSDYSYAFMDPLPDHAGWDALGVHTYQALGSCATGGLPTDFSVLYQDMRNFGIIFDVQDHAEAEIAKLQARVAELQKKTQDAGLNSLRIAPYDGFDTQPTYYGGLENAVISLAGSTYIWGNTDPSMQTSWEQFVAADPQVIWIVPDAGVSVDELEQRLETNPRLISVTGIKNKAYVIIPQSDATIESPRLLDGLEKLIDGLLKLKSS